MVNEAYLKKADPFILTNFYPTLYNTSYLLEDNQGKLSDRSFRFLDRHLVVDRNGSIPDMVGIATDPKYDELLGHEELHPSLTDRAFAIFDELKKRSSPLVQPPSYYQDNNILSSSLVHSKDSAPLSLAFVSYAYLELYSMFRALMEYREGALFGYTEDDFDMLDANFRKMRQIVAEQEKTAYSYSILNVLKLIHRTILFIRANMKMVLR